MSSLFMAAMEIYPMLLMGGKLKAVLGILAVVVVFFWMMSLGPKGKGNGSNSKTTKYSDNALDHAAHKGYNDGKTNWKLKK